MIIRDLNQEDLAQATGFYNTVLKADKDDFLEPFGSNEIEQLFVAGQYSAGAFKGANMLGLILVTPFEHKNLQLFSAVPASLSKEDNYVHIRALAIASQQRSSIIAYRLIERLVNIATSLGLGIVGEFDAQNHAARRLYFNLGGRPLLSKQGHILAARPPLKPT